MNAEQETLDQMLLRELSPHLLMLERSGPLSSHRSGKSSPRVKRVPWQQKRALIALVSLNDGID